MTRNAAELEQCILALVEDTIEDTRIPDAIAVHAGKRAGKPVTKVDAKALTDELGIEIRIRRQYGMTHVSWGPYVAEQSILLAHTDTGVCWPTSAALQEKNPAYFRARDERNAQRKVILGERRELAAQAAAAVVKLREAQAELEALIEFDAPLHIVRFDIKKMVEE